MTKKSTKYNGNFLSGEIDKYCEEAHLGCFINGNEIRKRWKAGKLDIAAVLIDNVGYSPEEFFEDYSIDELLPLIFVVGRKKRNPLLEESWVTIEFFGVGDGEFLCNQLAHTHLKPWNRRCTVLTNHKIGKRGIK